MLRMKSLGMISGLVLASAAQAQSTDEIIAQCRGTEPEAAIKACTKLIESGQNADIGYGNRANAYQSRGKDLHIKGDLDHAVADLTAYIHLKPDSAQGFIMRASVYDDQEKYDLALADLDEAARFEPDLQFAVYMNRGDTHNRMGDYGHAIEDFSEAIRLVADDKRKASVIYISRAYVYGKMKKYDQALADMDQAGKALPELVETTYFLLGRSSYYFYKTDYVHAIADESEIIRISPHQAMGFALRCWSRASLDQLYPAQEDCRQAIQLDPKSSRAFGGRGLIELKTGKLDEAISDFNESLKLTPDDNADSLYGRGVARIRKGDKSAGSSDIVAAEKIEGDVALRYTHYGISVN